MSGSFGLPNHTCELPWYRLAHLAYALAWSARAWPDKVFGLPPLDEWSSITTTTPFGVRPCTKASRTAGSVLGVAATRTALMPGKVFRIVAASTWPGKMLIPRAMNVLPSGSMIWPFATENWPVGLALVELPEVPAAPAPVLAEDGAGMVAEVSAAACVALPDGLVLPGSAVAAVAAVLVPVLAAGWAAVVPDPLVPAVEALPPVAGGVGSGFDVPADAEAGAVDVVPFTSVPPCGASLVMITTLPAATDTWDRSVSAVLLPFGLAALTSTRYSPAVGRPSLLRSTV